jgi:hypothetical protein
MVTNFCTRSRPDNWDGIKTPCETPNDRRGSVRDYHARVAERPASGPQTSPDELDPASNLPRPWDVEYAARGTAIDVVHSMGKPAYLERNSLNLDEAVSVSTKRVGA